MNLMTNSPTWLVLLLFAALVAAAIEDFIRLKISNITCLAVLITALIAMGLNGFPLTLWQNGVVFLVLLAAGTPLFAAGKMGGGDVKLLACLGLWVNISGGVWLLASTLIAGGILAVIYIAVRVARGARLGKKYQSKGIPYGIAIAAGASLIFAGQFGLLTPKPQRHNPLAIPTDLAG
jgi:prepilin peptidase CpaA